MEKAKDLTAVLPDGELFEFWERDQVYDRELHVSAAEGCDATGDGSREKPFKSINAAAALSAPGTKIVIHAGVYRECVAPAVGGGGPDKMISYEAAGDGEVIIKATEAVTGFAPSDEFAIGEDKDGTEPAIWEHAIDPDMFRGYNPFGVINCIHEKNWLNYARTQMEPYMARRGVVFADGKPLRQVQLYRQMQDNPGSYFVEQNGMKIHFRLPDDGSPENHIIEISCREQCFSPKRKNLGYIKVKGLTFMHAANGGPVPQHGALSCGRGHHWIVEDCAVNWANTVGFDIGNENWSMRKKPGQIFGHHVIRRNRLYDCGVCGVAGYASAKTLFEDNLFSGTGWQQMEYAWESGAIKLHECTDSLFRRNVFTKSIGCSGIWLDCNNKNDRITQNLFIDIRSPHGMLYYECNRGGDVLIDNNIFWNSRFYSAPDTADAFDSSNWNDPFDPGVPSGDGIHGDGSDDMHIAHNLFANIDGCGYSQNVVQFRMHSGRGGTSRNSIVMNNVFYDCRWAAMKLPNHDNAIDGNFYAKMPQGFLRITYPAPSEALDLAAWRRFEGYDLNGGYAAFKITVDADALTMTIKPARPSLRWVDDGSETAGYFSMKRVAPDHSVRTDYFGNAVEGDRLAGPFEAGANGAAFNIDPRKL